jgi:hypothetical protein
VPEGEDVDAGDFIVDSRPHADASEAQAGEASDVGDGVSAEGPDGPHRDAGDGPAEADVGDGALDAGPMCQDAKRNGQETDVDCGGPSCRPCEVGRVCLANRDCRTGNCSLSTCGLATGPPFWRSGVPMRTGRYLFSATMQPFGNKRGRIMVIGGLCGDILDDCSLDSYETFDTQGETWTTASLPATRYGGTALTDARGRVYLAHADGLWRFDGAWDTNLARPISDLPSTGAVALGSDGLIYAIGDNPVAVETYDPFTDRWSRLPTHPAKQGVFAAVSSKQLLYVLSSGLESFDVVTGAWSTLRNPPSPFEVAFEDAVALGPDGRIYAGGGGSPPDTDKAVWAYSPATNRWSKVAPLNSGHIYGAATVGPDGRIYLLGGSITAYDDAGFSTDVPSTGVEVYGPVASATPASGAPGTDVILAGSNFAANATVSVYLGPIDGTPLGKGATNGTGSIAPSISFRVPEVPAAETFLTIVDDLSQFPITLPFVVGRPPDTD